MTTKPQQGIRDNSGQLEPVEPALVVKIVVRPLTKVLNPVIVKLAGRRHWP